MTAQEALNYVRDHNEGVFHLNKSHNAIGRYDDHLKKYIRVAGLTIDNRWCAMTPVLVNGQDIPFKADVIF